MIGDVLDGNGVAESALYEIQRFLHIIGPFLCSGRLPVGELVRQQEKVFIQDAVHQQVPALTFLLCLKKPLVAGPQTGVPIVTEHQGFYKRGPLQVALDLDPLHSNPGVDPGLLPVRFVVDQLSGADEEGFSLSQMEGFAPALIDAPAAEDIVDHVPVSQQGTVAVARLAVFVAAGVDHGVNVFGEIVGKYIVLHVNFPQSTKCAAQNWSQSPMSQSHFSMFNPSYSIYTKIARGKRPTSFFISEKSIRRVRHGRSQAAEI